MTYRPGDVVFKEGDQGDFAFLVEDGVLEILAEGPPRRTIRFCGVGEIVGEMAIVGDGRRTATVIARSECRLLNIKAPRITGLLEASDPVLRLVVDTIMARTRELMDKTLAARPEEAAQLLKRQAILLRAVTQLRKESDLRQAIEQNEITLHHQPVVSLKSGAIVGYEALARWHHPSLGLVPPSEFIPLAETSGLITQLTQACLERAADALDMLDARFGADRRLFLNVNVSGTDIVDRDFAGRLVDLVRRRPIIAGRLKIEMTETALMADPAQALATLQACRTLGIGVAIDDFGTGYSSLAYLHKLPIDVLKIDQSFVRGLAVDGQSAKIIKTILHLAEDIDVPVVCEGLETASEVSALTGMGCDFGQGYHFARPRSLADVCETEDRSRTEFATSSARAARHGRRQA